MAGRLLWSRPALAFVQTHCPRLNGTRKLYKIDIKIKNWDVMAAFQFFYTKFVV